MVYRRERDVIEDRIAKNAVAGPLDVVERGPRLFDQPVDAARSIVEDDGIRFPYLRRVDDADGAAEGEDAGIVERADHLLVARVQQDLVGEKQHEIGAADRPLRAFDGVDEAALLPLNDVFDRDAAVAVAELVDDRFSLVAHKEHNLVDPRPHGVVEVVLDDVAAVEEAHTLVPLFGQRVQALSAAPGEKQRLHDTTSASARNIDKFAPIQSTSSPTPCRGRTFARQPRSRSAF